MQQAAGGGEGLQGLLQNPKVQIGVIAGGAIALIVVVYTLFFSDRASAPPSPPEGETTMTAVDPAGGPAPPTDPSMMGGAPPTDPSGAAPGSYDPNTGLT